MSKIRVGVIVGSLRADSINLKLAKAIEKLTAEALSFEFICIGELPSYTQDLDANYPEEAQRFKQSVEAVQALLFVTPEYNRSMPGVLKNALDVGSRPWGTNSFDGKVGAVIGASIGAMGSALAQQHLRNVLSYLNVVLLPQPELYLKFEEGSIDADGTITSERTRTFLQGFADAYVAWVHAQVKTA